MAKRVSKIDSDKSESTPSETVAAGSISKAEAIRRAIAAGYEMPEEGTQYILSTFGIDVTKQHFSASKSQLKSKEAQGKVGRAKGRPRSEAIEGYLAPPPRQRSGGQPDLLESLEVLKPLVASLGAEKVKRLADLLG